MVFVGFGDSLERQPAHRDAAKLMEQLCQSKLICPSLCVNGSAAAVNCCFTPGADAEQS